MSATPRRILRHCKSSSGPPSGKGTVFKIIQGGTLTTLYCFCSQSGCPDGNSSLAALTTLYSFCSQSGCTDGDAPYAGLVQATDGNFYGTTVYGGANGGYGTVFKITPGGTLTTLYSFCSQSGCTDGAYPDAGLVQDSNGDFNGTTANGGGYGTVFRLSVGLGSFVKPRPPYGKVGAAVKILGTNLTGATSVGINGTAAVFEVVSSSEITTTVPAGASSGKVQVVTPSGTLSSNASFRVVP